MVTSDQEVGVSPAEEPNVNEWIDGQWDGYTPDQLLDVLLAQPV